MLTLADVRAAARRIDGRIRRTPVLHSSSLDAVAGSRVLLKAEHLQRSGSFKVRGAFNAVLQLRPEDLRRGVLAVSSGNHGQAVALAAREVGAAATVVMPADANPAKVQATLSHGAKVNQQGVSADNRERVVRELAGRRGLALVHPYDDLRVMAGQGTVGLELGEQVGEPDAIVVPVGGGGLLSGVAVAVREGWPRARIVGVEPSTAADVRASMLAGRRTALDRAPDTIADGVRALCVGEEPWEVIRRLVDEVVTVDDDQTLDAMELIWTRTKTVAEPAGALALAAVISGAVRGSTVALVVSGGNVDLDAWADARRS